MLYEMPQIFGDAHIGIGPLIVDCENAMKNKTAFKYTKYLNQSKVQHITDNKLLMVINVCFYKWEREITKYTILNKDEFDNIKLFYFSIAKHFQLLLRFLS